MVAVLLALHAGGAEAAPPECLSGVDDLIVEFDIPVSQQIPGAQPAPSAARRTARHRHALDAAQRKRLGSALRRARMAEARGDEAACMTLLRQARSIAATAR